MGGLRLDDHDKLKKCISEFGSDGSSSSSSSAPFVGVREMLPFYDEPKGHLAREQVRQGLR
jgi:hypothetical protein